MAISLTKENIVDQFYYSKMAAEVNIVSGFNMYQGRQLCSVKREDLVIDLNQDFVHDTFLNKLE